MSGILKFVESMNPKVFTVLLIVAMVIPLAIPIALPMSISEYSQTFYNYIVNHKGETCLWAANTAAFGVTTGLHADIVAVMDALFKNDIKVIIAPCGYTSNVLTNDFFLYVIDNYKLATKYGKTYGVDYVSMPWLGNVESAMATVAQFGWDNDYKTNLPKSQLPIFAGLTDVGDVDFVVTDYGHCLVTDEVIRQFYTNFGREILAMEINCFGPTVAYIGTGMVSVIDGTQGAAEIETLNGVPGLGLTYTTPISVLLTTFFVLLIAGNVVYWAKRALGTGKEVVKEEVKK